MSVVSSPIPSPSLPVHGTLRRAVAMALRRSPLPLVAMGCTLAWAGPAFSQDARTVEQVQAEVARLKELLQKEEPALAAKASGQTPAGAANAANGSANTQASPPED
jgi:hypothetical protein